MRKIGVIISLLILLNNFLLGQTNPTPQSLPYSQDFSSLAHSTTTFPDGWQGWTISTSPGATFNTSAPTADRTLTASSTASTTSGNVHNYNGKIGYLNTSSLDLTVVVAINTTGYENIDVEFDIMTIRNPYDGGSNTRINEVTLQYRVGTSGAFTTLTGVEYQNNTTTQTSGTDPQNLQNKTITLPSACDNEPIVQLRWASRQVSGIGSRPSFAVDNINITGTAVTTPTIVISPSTISNFSYVVGSGPSSSQTYELSGSNLDPAAGDLTVTGSTNYEVSLNGTDFFSSVNVSYSGGSLSATDIYVRLKAGLSAGAYNGETIANSGGGATTQNVTVNGKVLATEPTVQASGVNFTDVTETSFTINWTNGDGASRIVLMKYFGAVDDVPVDGSLYNANSSFGTISTEIGIGNYVVYKGTGSSAAITGLWKGRIYHVAVFEYNGSDNYENYLTTSPAGGSQRTSGPTLTEIIYPQYMQGTAGTNNNRIPYAYRVKISGLSPSSTYRYYNMVVDATDGHTTNGAGNVIFAQSSGDFVRTTSGGLGTAGNYGEFTTDASGEHTGWFITEPTGNPRFTASGFVHMQIILNNGAGGTTIDARLTLDNGVYVMDFGTSPLLGQGTGIRSLSGASPKDFVFLYDNESGTGRPISGTFVESDGTSGGTTYVSFYQTDVDATNGAWGTIIPNLLPNGIRRIERRLLADASLGEGTSTSPDGMWGAVNTVDPSGGSTPLVIPASSAPLPVELASFSASVVNGKVKLSWKTETETNNYGFEIQRSNSASTDGSSKPLTWKKIGFVEGAVNSNSPKSYSFTDNNVNFGLYSYRLKQVDTDGKFEYSFIVEADLGTPKEFALNQNYPNPFNPTTTISFTLPEAVDVKITVFNILGQEVATILNQKKEAGVHSVEFDASELNSGLYIYRMDAGKYSNVRKMLLVK